MNILVGNNGFSYPGGSETYNFALIESLVNKGHDVVAISKNGPGMVSKKLNDIGVEVHFGEIDASFDICLLSHCTSIELAKKVKGFKIQTCHGIYPYLEQPVEGMNAYVSISEEVHEHLYRLGYKSNVIRNGINHDRFYSKKPINEKLSVVLSLAQSDEANSIIEKSCNIIGCKLITLNKFKERKWDVEDFINESDLVISLGRGAYESMACGRNLVIFDKRNYMDSIGDGFTTMSNVSDYIKNNCSGRFSNRIYDEYLLSNELLKYDSKHGKDLKEFSLKELNIDIQSEKYLSMLN